MCGLGNVDVLIAYIDGGSGSLLVQALIAGVVGTAATIRVFWSQIKARLFGTKPKEEDD